MSGKYKVMVVGCGNMARSWIEYVLESSLAEIVALVDIKPDKARNTARKYGLKVDIFSDLTEALTRVDPDIVFDITIPEAHCQVVTSALEAGCHVFGEKPLAATMEEARKMVSTARKTEKMYAVMQNRRYLKDIRAYRNLIASGIIGKPGFVCADFFLGPHFGGFRDEMDSPLILDMAIHTFDQARFIMNADPISVYCHEFNPAGSWYKGNAAAVCTFEFSDGSVFSYRGSWCAEGVQTSWESFWRITGSKGTAIWDGENTPYAEVIKTLDDNNFINEYKKIEADYEWQGKEGHTGCLDEMFKALEEDRQAETDCRDNIKSMAMVFSALESTRRKKKILIEY